MSRVFASISFSWTFALWKHR